MRLRWLLLVVFVAAGAGAMAQRASTAAPNKPITPVYQNNDHQFTGITASKENRLFINFPRWSDRYLDAVVEVLNGGVTRPYPDEAWNRWDSQPETAGKAFVCVQSVVADDRNSLWVLDPAAPMLGPVVAGGAKLVEISLDKNEVTRVIPFGPDVATKRSYLNDVRIDTRGNVAYITDSGIGGIIVLDLASGKARRLLDGHPSVLAEQEVDIVIDRKPVRDETDKPPTIHSDGIALSPDGEHLYYQALRGATLYRVPTRVLRDDGAQPGAVAAAVEKVAKTFPVDGLWMDPQGRIYLSGITQNAILRMLPGGKIETLASDPRLAWPDTFTQGPDAALYVTASHIHHMPRFNRGKSTRTMPYGIFKLIP
jgi:sugar lactone lactonase YvrE